MFPLTIGIFLPGIASDLLVDVSAPSEVSLALETLTDVDAGFDCLFEDSMTVRYLSSLVCFASLLLLAMSWEQFRGREEYEAQEQFWSCFFNSSTSEKYVNINKNYPNLTFASKEVKVGPV